MKCNCGSGAHPRKCNLHTKGYQAHIDEINLWNAIPDGLSEEDEKDLEEAIENLAKSSRAANQEALMLEAMIDLEPIKKMLSRISTPPWELDDDGSIDTESGGAVCFIQPHGCHETIFRTGETFSHADGEFIAAAPTLIRELIEEIERLRCD